MAKKIALRLVLLFLIVVASNFIYKYTFYPSDLKNNGSLTQKLDYGINNSDILFFSASPNTAYPKGDPDTRSISKILDDNLDNYSVTSIDTGAIHAGVYKKLIKMIPDDNTIKYVVVNMNYRSFGISWMFSPLENTISKQALFYNDHPELINKFLQGLNAYHPLSVKERHAIMKKAWGNHQLPFDFPKNTVTNWCAVEKWGGLNDPKRNLADNYLKNYAFQLDENNQRIKDFDEIVTICKSKNIPLVFNILGENLTQTEYLIDSDLTDLMRDNKNYLMDRYSSKDVIMVDNFENIADSCFYERHFPTEHYNFSGRKLIADQIAKEILKFEEK